MAMASPSTVRLDIEQDILLNDIMQASLDPHQPDFTEVVTKLRTERRELQQKLDALDGRTPEYRLHTPDRGSQQCDEDTDNSDNFSSQSVSSGDHSRTDGHASSLHVHANLATGRKRAFPGYLSVADERDSKRSTPERALSAASAPTYLPMQNQWSSNSTLSLLDKATKWQRQAEADLQQRRIAQMTDEQYARQLSEQYNQPVASASSVSCPSTQTIIGTDGSYRRPPPSPQMLALPTGLATQQSAVYTLSEAPHEQSTQSIGNESGTANTPATYLSERPRQTVKVVDLTGDSDDNRAVHQDPRGRGNVTLLQPPIDSDVPRLPGSYPTLEPQWPQIVVDPPNASFINSRKYHGTQQAPGPTAFAEKWTRNTAIAPGGGFAELGGLIHGSRNLPWNLFDDDDEDEDLDYMYGYRRPHVTAKHKHRAYEDFYSDHFDMISHNDPAKIREEINALLENIRPDEDLPENLRVNTPEALTVTLHKYQEVGLSWLQSCETSSNKGGILADDMGLGKTIQMLSLLVSNKSNDSRCKATLIIAPVALMRQWKQEIEGKVKRGQQHLTVYIHHGPAKKKRFNDLAHYDVVLSTYGSVAIEGKKMEKLLLRRKTDPQARPSPSDNFALLGDDAKWYRCVLDEAQCIKNRRTQTAKGACLINAKYRFCMTGTPMMNNLEELYSLIKFLRIPPYNSWEKFRVDFTTPLRSYSDEVRANAMRKLQTLCKAIMLRRTKKSTFEGKPILVLPERTSEESKPEFSTDERDFYNAIENKTQLEFNRYVERGTVGKDYSAILVILLRLRQACCHPHLLRDFSVAGAADVTQEQIVEFAKQLDDVVVARIKETGGNFECPVCYDAVPNPAIFIPCGHDTCADCLAKLSDPDNAIRDGDAHARVRCPKCRGNIDPQRVTDFQSFRKVHMPELLTPEELEQMRESDDSDDDDDDDSDSDEDDVDRKGNLKDFIVDDDDDNDDVDTGRGVDRERTMKNFIVDEDAEAADISETETAGDIDGTYLPNTSSEGVKQKIKIEQSKKRKGRKKGKGRAKENQLTLAELKKMSLRNAAAKKKYIKRLRKTWVSSAKIDKTMDLLHQIMTDAEGEKVLIFSQWTSLLDLLEVPIDTEGWKYRRYDGSLSTRMRNDAVDDFRDPQKNIRIMLVSLKAGNAGLNLNMASQVIILDPFWNPFIEEQAIDRAHRMGQLRPVKVHRMLIPDTVEDRIVILQEKKRALIGEALDENAGRNIARLGVQELAYLFGVTRNPNQNITYTPANAR